MPFELASQLVDWSFATDTGIDSMSNEVKSPGHVLMVPPRDFRYNEDTARTNTFPRPSDLDPATVAVVARQEFGCVVETLRREGISVTILPARPDIDAPDAVFPNNWLSFHEDGSIVLYPMRHNSRRLEIRPEILKDLQEQGLAGFHHVHDLTGCIEQEMYLEGTGSLVLDRRNRIAYASLSERTTASMVHQWCALMNYRPVTFSAFDAGGFPLYHTNVMMSIGEHLAVICAESIADENERAAVLHQLESTGHYIVQISLQQMSMFAGNVLELYSLSGERLLLMSARALASLHEDQIAAISRTNRIVAVPIDIIEYVGGGGIRCMMAEVDEVPKCDRT